MSGVSLSVFSLAVVLCLAELAFRFFPAVDNSYPESSWWYKAKWYDSHRHSIEKFSYAIDEHHPLYGWMLKPGLKNFAFTNYTISSTTNRTRSTMPHSNHDTSCLKILALGDSFTFGECVNDSNSYPAYLQQLVEASEVINAGVHGWGHDQMLLRLQTEGNTYAPDVVILGCFNADLARNHLSFRDYAKPYYTLQADSLLLHGVPVESPEELLTGFRPRVVDFVSSRTSFLFDRTEQLNSDPLSAKILQQIILECRKINAVPVFVYLPWQGECLTGKSNPSIIFKEVCETQQVLWIDPTATIHSSLRTLAKPEQEFVCHYSPFINKVLAGYIRDVLADNNLLQRDSL